MRRLLPSRAAKTLAINCLAQPRPVLGHFVVDLRRHALEKSSSPSTTGFSTTSVSDTSCSWAARSYLLGRRGSEGQAPSLSTSTSLKIRRRRSGQRPPLLQLDLVRDRGASLMKRRRRERGFEVPLQCGRSAVVRRREQRAVRRRRCRQVVLRRRHAVCGLFEQGALTVSASRRRPLSCRSCSDLTLGALLRYHVQPSCDYRRVRCFFGRAARQALRQPATALQKAAEGRRCAQKTRWQR